MSKPKEVGGMGIGNYQEQIWCEGGCCHGTGQKEKEGGGGGVPKRQHVDLLEVYIQWNGLSCEIYFFDVGERFSFEKIVQGRPFFHFLTLSHNQAQCILWFTSFFVIFIFGIILEFIYFVEIQEMIEFRNSRLC